MNDQPILADAALEAMLARRAGPAAPAGLAESIGAALVALPEDRRPWWSVLAPPAGRNSALRLAWIVAVVGLLMAATVSAVFVGSELLRRSSQLTVVPPPTVVPAPSAAPASTAAPVVVATRPVEQVNDLAFGADGTLWLATRGGVIQWDVAASAATLYGQADGLPATEALRVAVGPDGSAWASGAAWVARFDGAWTAHSESGDLGALGVVGDLGGIAVDADATLWVTAFTNEGPRLLRYDGTWTAIEVPESIAGDAYPWASRLEVAPDGTVWAGAWGPGVASYDGTTWTAWSKAATGLPRTPSFAGIAPDGSAWVELQGEGCAVTDAGGVSCRTPAAGVARFDRARWTIYSTASGLVDDEANIVISADGTVWATYPAVRSVVSRLKDGEWVTTQVGEPGLLSQAGAARAFGAAPDGALWLTTAEGLLRWDGAAKSTYHWPAVETPAALPPLALEPLGEPTVIESALGTITWRVYEASPEHFLSSLTGTPRGPVVLDGFVDLRWSGPDGTWEGATLPGEGWGLAPVGDGLVAYGSWPARHVSWDGSRWVVGDDLDLSPFFGNVERIAAGPRGVIVTGMAGGVAVARDGQRFVATAQPPGGGDTIGSVLATADGFVALVTARETAGRFDPVVEPVPWFSADGYAWEPASPASPFGEGARIRGVAGRDGRFVAVGNIGSDQGPWAAWVSDDGRSWERLPDLERAEPCPTIEGVDYCLTLMAGVTADDAGWIIYSWDGAAWASTDGLTWEPLRGWPGIRGGYIPPEVAIGGDTIVAIGSVPGPWKDVVVVGTIEP